MIGDISSLLWYFFPLLLGLLVKLIFKNSNAGTNIFFLIILCFCGLRYCVGNDYENYVILWESFSNGTFPLSRAEPGYLFLNYLFSKFEYGYYYVFFFAAFITYYFVFKAIKQIQVDSFLAFFAIFTLGFLITCNDQVRQGIAMALFFYSLKFVVKENFIKYSSCLLIASLFHYTALLFIPLYFLFKLKFELKWYVWFILICAFYILSLSGFFYSIMSKLIVMIPYYGELYMTKLKFLEQEQLSSGFGLLFVVLNGLYVSFLLNIKFSRTSSQNLYIKIYLLGILLFIVSNGFMLPERISFYFLYTNIFVIPIILNQKKYKLLNLLFIIGILVYYGLQSYYGLEKHGAVPYRSILFENYQVLNFI